ncbi:hypothetical protein EUTSA_v10027347mg [Eutrema salsugineum]|uniref:Auxin-responsive protein n=1 Tax=Eutrema salsugineum TaxID=72664 RepID=V4MC03_EUTSA|nr:auxin-responsive protein IAA29 [Eutrema salsugineum]ESQ53949.1 hypothetical protein EUTSA_v10027347mg [Eutrema salsugineum]
MELDLDLSLSPHTNSSNLGFGFDLNKHCAIESVASCLDIEKLHVGTMFGFEDIEEDSYVPKSRLFSLNGQPNEEEEDPLESDSSIVYDEEENSEVVGWPPIKSCRTKFHNYRHHSRIHPYHHHGRRINIYNPTATIERGRPSSPSSSSSTSSRSSMYVKVKMDGVAISRKVDIKLFNSYESLTNSLITMFSQFEGCDREDTNYKFTFQGKDGDWLLPGDVPWKIFAESVHRISIIKDRPCAYTRLLF